MVSQRPLHDRQSDHFPESHLSCACNIEKEFFFLGGIDSWRMIVNTDYGMPLVPEKKYPRSETVDFQRGEVEWEGGNLYFPQWSYHMDIDYLNY